MFDKIFDASTIPVLEQVVNFTEARHGVLAGNIANMDTPGYRTRDLSPELFQQHLQTAIDRRDAGTRPRQPGQPRHGGGANFEPFREVEDSLKNVLYHDESDVSIEHQIAEISKNQSLHNIALGLMVSQFQQLHAAISENVS